MKKGNGGTMVRYDWKTKVSIRAVSEELGQNSWGSVREEGCPHPGGSKWEGE